MKCIQLAAIDLATLMALESSLSTEFQRFQISHAPNPDGGQGTGDRLAEYPHRSGATPPIQVCQGCLLTSTVVTGKGILAHQHWCITLSGPCKTRLHNIPDRGQSDVRSVSHRLILRLNDNVKVNCVFAGSLGVSQPQLTARAPNRVQKTGSL